MSFVVVLVMLALPVRSAFGQNVETDPIQCWWRTSAGAVRVGQPFSAVLTCGVIETPEVKVVVDESRLEPSVVQFAPFETLGGSHAADLRNGDRRFFQYEYVLRVIAENLFGKDVALPETKINYRIQSTISQSRANAPRNVEETIAGRDQTYVLPPLSVRLLSVVPTDATDIRDATHETFADIDRETFRANLFVVIGGVLFALAGLVAILAAVRAILRSRKPGAAADRLVSDSAILRGVGRELAEVRRRRDEDGWNPDLAARALAALRIVATYALGREATRAVIKLQDSRPIGQPSASTKLQPAAAVAIATDSPEQVAVKGGSLVFSSGWPRTKQVAVFGAATPQSIAATLGATSRNGHRDGDLEALGDALARFTTAQYGRSDGDKRFDDVALDESLATGQRLLRRLKVQQTWLMKRLRRRPATVAAGSRVWSR